jgi:Secretion system C-terminal sorting domain
MKYISTLFATGALAMLGFGAQAQAPITVNGQLAATEVGTTGYQLVGRMAGPRGFGDAGLLSMYAAADANNLYFFIAGTLETQGSGAIANSIQLFIDRPGVAGVPVGTALPAPTGTGAASFANMTARLDLAPDLAIGMSGTGTAAQVQVTGVAYTSATAATAGALTGTTPLGTTGTAGTVTAANASGALAPFAGAMVAYTTSANLSSNPGFASNGNAPSNGLEIMVSRTAMGLPAAGGAVQVFALMNNQDGGFLSTDIIPAVNPTPTGAANNFGTAANVNFATVPGTQAATLNVTATGLTVVNSNRRAAAELALNVYPNPVLGESTVAYRVQNAQQPINIELTDLTGRRVRTLFQGQQAVGVQTQKLQAEGVATGTYLVKVQVGEQVATHKVSLL